MALPIRARLTLWYSGVLAMIVIALGVFLHVRLRADLIAGLDQSLVTRAQQVALAVEDKDFEDLDSIPGLPPGDTVAQVVSADGTVRRSSDTIEQGVALVPPAIARSALRGSVRGETRVVDAEDAHRFLAAALPDGERILVVAAPLEGVDDATDRLKVLLLFATPVALVIAGLGGWLLTRRALSPIDRMTSTAAAIGSDDLDARLDVPAVSDEVGRLGATLNGMLSRLQGAITEQRRFAADASHELRTPLSILQAELDVALRSPDTPGAARATLDSAREEVVRMARIVEDLLMLARADEGAVRLERAPTDLARLVAGVAERFRHQADAGKLTLEVEGAPLVVHGDDEHLRLLTSNLLGNALKYTPAGGSVRATVRADDGVAVIEVSDTGIGIPADAIPHVFDRFYRVDAARTRSEGGTGLGLAICRWIAEAHGGTIDATSNGAGSTFIVRIPTQGPAPD